MQILPTIDVHLDKQCVECGKGGATGNQLCMGCTSKAIRGLKMKSDAGREVQKRFDRTVRRG